ncbi:extracellular solute-binding protein, partial [Paenibacillus sp. GYB003]|uniref:extracellular solute-binding protein n=1 Tax=Paenibacillus sp. GYB003 TaxID=2994392 RepID=UPI002F9664C7
KYPHITVENVVSKEDLTKLIAAGETVDFYVTYNGNMAAYTDLGVYGDLTPMAKQMNFDLTQFDQGALDAIKVLSDKGELYGLPYAINLNALYYNKDLFDKFGVAYPKDGMTWEDAIELAKKVTRFDGGTQYKGLDVDGLVRLTYPLSLTYIDGKTNEVQVDSESFKRAFDIGRQIYGIPGNDFIAAGAKSYDRFLKDRVTSMIATVNLFSRIKEHPDLNWDVAQFPSYKDKPNTYGMYDVHLMIPLQTSKHREDQMRVMEVLFSDEVQTKMVRKTGRVSALKDPKYAQLFGKDMPILEGKRIESIFKSKSAPAPKFSLYESKANGVMNAEYTKVVKGEKDSNTALRDAAESIRQLINAQTGK